MPVRFSNQDFAMMFFCRTSLIAFCIAACLAPRGGEASSPSLTHRRFSIERETNGQQSVSGESRLDSSASLSFSFPDSEDEELNGVSTPCHHLFIENRGVVPLRNCFPSLNHSPSLTLPTLANRIAGEAHPLLCLYSMWDNNVKERSDAYEGKEASTSIAPLDRLNFTGSSPSGQKWHHFMHLCRALGIGIQRSAVHGAPLYDFRLQQEWQCLDLEAGRFYVSIDNLALASSHDVMDDPFLALRTPHVAGKAIDFHASWKRLADFAIVDPEHPVTREESLPEAQERPEGFDLYPSESLTYDIGEEETHYRCTHLLNMTARRVGLSYHYASPIPIREVVNLTQTPLEIVGMPIRLLPGEKATLTDSSPFAVTFIFSQVPHGNVSVSGSVTSLLYPHVYSGANQLKFGNVKGYEDSSVFWEVARGNPSLSPVVFLAHPEIEQVFDHCQPIFTVEPTSCRPFVEAIEWQIATTPLFECTVPLLSRISPFHGEIALDRVDETFLNSGVTYYLRIRGYQEGRWGSWSHPHPFTVYKPMNVAEVEIEATEEGQYILDWSRDVEQIEQGEEPIVYWVFGSNALDFVPSLYCDKQVNAIVDGEVIEEEKNDTLLTMTQEPRLTVPGHLAFYRIVAQRKGQFSTPSPLFHLYDSHLVQPRHVLQHVEEEEGKVVAKRILFPSPYPSLDLSLPSLFSGELCEEMAVTPFQKLLNTAARIEAVSHPYAYPHVKEDIWEMVKPYLLPANHPAWPKLNRLFGSARVTQHPEAFRRAGFPRWRPGRWSRVSASSHPDLPGYFIKAYCDSERGIVYDAKKWIHRIKGAESIRQCIKSYGLGKHFKVPRKWIYPMPHHPSPPRSVQYVRKNFILLCEDMNILGHKENERMYKDAMTPQLAKGIYTIMQVCGLYDSVYPFNVPFCRDGKIAIIDTEYHHKWPVPYRRFDRVFSKEMKVYWQRLTHNGGKIPAGTNEPNPPRMDRRDVLNVR